ncbi:hypothetical protein MNBD_GAMMA09-2684 [hydrothermal vent metagenome]|uniref:Uncharacterized protein n=1 Tax=hydrothermal vent metagenome TaxID=652676 RepID=A0A3B0XQ55_9ZZZZ
MGMATSFNETMKCKSLKLNTTNLEYWATKGLNQRMQELSSGLWCDGSASIIMSRLTQQPKFTSPLTVVEQGNAKRSGHWWIIANLEKENPSYKGPFGRNAFTIDIWGALERIRRGDKINTCVFKPAVALYNCGNNNKLKIHCTAHHPLL